MVEVALPDADWRRREGLDALIAALGGDDGDARFVGGIVRDTLIGIAAADIDIATRHAPETVLERLRSANIRSVPTGLAHGTITALLPGGPVEVTTLRRDVATDGRHAVVAFTDDWREDAARRDFTINALYADPLSGALFDYFGGRDDLAAGRVRFIGNPLERIAEDHLRILRFFRFQARFGTAVDADALQACAARANDLMALSRERIAAELLKLLVAPGAVAVVGLMIEHGIFRPIIPEILPDGAARLAALASNEHAAAIAPHPIRRLAALLPQDPEAADRLGARLKLSNTDRRRLMIAATPAQALPAREIAYRLGIDSAIDQLLLAGGDVGTLIGWDVPRMPIGGGALVERGLRKGPEVARTMRRIEDQWIAEGFPDVARVEAIADAEVAQALRSSSS